MNLTLHVWRQDGPKDKGRFNRYEAHDVSPDMSFLEMLDVLNESLVEGGEEPIAIDHDCREGICGTCGVVINGKPHGPWPGTATCQLHMREYSDGDQIWIEPWRAKAFPVIRDLVVDRTALTRSRSRRRRRTSRWTRHHALAAAPASRSAPTRLPCCSRLPRSRT